MPIYEYECQACNHRFEEWQKMSDKPVKVCPKCKARKVEKLISHTSFQLKGGGWYSDLYSSQKPGSSDKSEKSGDKSESSPISSGTAVDTKSGAESKAGESAGSTSSTTDSKDKSKGKKGATKAAAA
jgi:putative FmdB family regulatory protein